MEKEQTFMNLYREKDPDTIVYVTGLIVAAAISTCYFVIFFLQGKGLIPRITTCPFYLITGIYCPGCGGTRALHALIHGHIIKSLYYHPLVIYGVILGLVFYISQTLRFLSRGKIKGLHMRTAYPVIAGIIILLNWIIKNVILLVTHTELLI
ncbi:MAG: DUF2752 domain-containing protein [Butyrivibrio sp.]